MSSSANGAILDEENSLGLKQKVFKGISWNILEQVTSQFISLAVTVILARLLSPDDYGLVALSAIFVGFILIFENLAMGSAIIQRKEINDVYISTSFWASVVTGLFLALVLCAVAPFAAWYYEQPLLKYIIMVSSLSLVISPIFSIHKSLLTRELQFAKLFIIGISQLVIASIISIVLALLGQGVWSLVLGGLIASIFSIPLVWIIVPWRPKRVFDKKCFQDLFGFSSYLLAFNIFNYFARNFDNMIIGKVLGSATLGIYSIAYSIMMKPLSQISWSITRVLFPAFSSIQGDKSRVRLAYLSVVSGISFITFPMMAGLMMVSPEFVMLFLGDKWLEVIIPLQLLCLVGALQSIGTTVGSIFNSQGRTDLLFKTGVITSLGHVIGFIICIRWGLHGLIKGYIVTNIIFFFFNQYFANRLIELSIKDFLLAMKLPILNSGIMVLALIGYRTLNDSILHLNIALFLGTSITLGFVLYVSLTLLFMEKNQLQKFKSVVYQQVSLSTASVK